MSNSSGMSDFARQQAEFQRGIIDGDDTVLVEILDSPREKRETLFGVYRPIPSAAIRLIPKRFLRRENCE